MINLSDFPVKLAHPERFDGEEHPEVIVAVKVGRLKRRMYYKYVLEVYPNSGMEIAVFRRAPKPNETLRSL